MHARDLIELAALASAHGPLVVAHTERFPADAIERYWTASKCRIDRWSGALKLAADGHLPLGQARRRSDASPTRTLLEEILTGELLTRVWAGVLALFDRRHGRQEVDPVGRSVLAGHLEVRRRALNLLVDGVGLASHESTALNRLRRRAERWSDLLIGHLSTAGDATEFAVCPERAREFADDLCAQKAAEGRDVWPVTLAAMRAAFATSLSRETPNGDLNAEIARAVVSCFEPSLFETTGVFRSLWLMRLASFAGDAQGMIDELFAAESASSSQRAAIELESQEAFLRRRRY